MEFKAYKLTYYLNAQHSMNYNRDNAHGHTFIISLYLDDLSKKEFLNFSQMDEMVNGLFGRYSGKYLNGEEPFTELTPTIENMGSVFYEHLKAVLSEQGYDLIQIDICENPLRVYSISDRLYLGSNN